MSSTSRAVARYSYGLPSDRSMPYGPSTYASASSQPRPTTYDASSSRRHGSRRDHSAANSQVTTAIATAGAVPRPHPGDQYPCSGGNCAWSSRRVAVSQPVTIGHPIATATRSDGRHQADPRGERPAGRVAARHDGQPTEVTES